MCCSNGDDTRRKGFCILILLASVFCADALSLSPVILGEEIGYLLQRFSGTGEPRDLEDTVLTTPELIREAGYPAESHTVVTEDGYFLTIHRIPGNESSPVVFLQHGLLSSSADWIFPGKHKSLAFILADEGYDVWLGNFRGNTYSRAHTTLPVTGKKFWDFSWHEHGIYDLPCMITYVAHRRNRQLAAYIGHSMGTTSFYVMASEREEAMQFVRSMYSLAPVAFMSHLKSPLRLLAPFVHDIEMIIDLFGEGEFLPQNSFLKFIARYGCDTDLFSEKICANSLFILCGFDKAEFNYTLLPLILSHTPAGTSTKTVTHYAQEIESGHFRQYDYGREKNMEIYNSFEPPDYNLSKISLPMAFFYSKNDWLASPIDVLQLSKQVTSKVNMNKVAYPKFNHLDFLWATDAPKQVYKRLLFLLKKYVRKNV